MHARTPFLIIIAAALTAAGCAGPASVESTDSRGTDAGALAGPRVESSTTSDLVPVVNAWCPIAPDNAVSSTKTTAKPLTRTWRGQRIGFCCDACPPTWDALTDEDKSAALSRAIRREHEVAVPTSAATEP